MTEAEQKDPEAFEPVTLPYPALYEEIGLDPLGPGYAGRTMRVLVNPSVRFRRDFTSSGWAATTEAGNVWMRHVATILGATDYSELEGQVSDMDPDALHWLLVPHLMEDPFIAKKITAVQPYICEVWDRWISGRVKARAAPSKPSGVAAAVAG